jgi:hypothetical protein
MRGAGRVARGARRKAQRAGCWLFVSEGFFGLGVKCRKYGSQPLTTQIYVDFLYVQFTNHLS